MSEALIAAISTEGLAAPADPPDGGAAPQLRWLSVDKLLIDRAYQREILRAGRANILKIARGFDWAFFAPVVVSPAEGDFYAIVDGQHRATAAKLIGKAMVPCCIVIAGRQKQAAAFRAINGNVTPMHQLQIHAAAVAAQEPDALFLETLAREAGVTILRSPREARRMLPGQTLAVQAIRGALARFGRELTVAVLAAIARSPRQYRGFLNRDMIIGACLALQRLTPAEARHRLDAINLSVVDREASQAWEQRGGRRQVLICEAIAARLTPRSTR